MIESWANLADAHVLRLGLDSMAIRSGHERSAAEKLFSFHRTNKYSTAGDASKQATLLKAIAVHGGREADQADRIL